MSTIATRLAALFGSRRGNLEEAARDARAIVSLARKLDRYNLAVANAAEVRTPQPREQVILSIAKPYLRKGERIVFGNDPRGPAVRLITTRLEADCIAGGTAIQ